MPSRVALLMSIRATDETSMRLLPEAMDGIRCQHAKTFPMLRFVEADPIHPPWIPTPDLHVCATPELEPQPVTLNHLWGVMEQMGGFEYAAVYNADDAWLPGELDRLVAALDADPKASLAYGDFLMLCPGRKPFSGNVPKPRTQDVAVVPVPCPFYLMRIDAVRRAMASDGIEPFDPRFPRTFDHALAVRLATVGPFAFVAEPVATYVNREDSLSHADPSGIQVERRELQRWAVEYLRNRERFA